MTIFLKSEIPIIEIDINDEFILRFYMQANGEYTCTLPEWLLSDLQTITGKYNRKIKLIEGK